jgi:hypothetical protein
MAHDRWPTLACAWSHRRQAPVIGMGWPPARIEKSVEGRPLYTFPQGARAVNHDGDEMTDTLETLRTARMELAKKIGNDRATLCVLDGCIAQLSKDRFDKVPLSAVRDALAPMPKRPRGRPRKAAASKSPSLQPQTSRPKRIVPPAEGVAGPILRRRARGSELERQNSGAEPGRPIPGKNSERPPESALSAVESLSLDAIRKRGPRGANLSSLGVATGQDRDVLSPALARLAAWGFVTAFVDDDKRPMWRAVEFPAPQPAAP